MPSFLFHALHRSKHGVIVRRAWVVRWTREVEAATRVQCAARGFLGRLVANAKINWIVFNQLENDEEKVQPLCVCECVRLPC